MYKFSATALSVVLGLTLGATSAFAATGAVTSALQTTVGVTTGVTTGTSGSVNADGSVTTGTTGTNDSGSAAMTDDVGTNLNINVMQATAQDTSASGALTVTSADKVSTLDSLTAYTNSVQMNSQGMSMSYARPAHLLGFIPASMNVGVQVAADGTVSVKYPWYSFLMSTDQSRTDLQNKLQADVTAMQSDGTTMSANDSAMASTSTNSQMSSGSGWTNRMRAMVLERLHADLNANASASATQ